MDEWMVQLLGGMFGGGVGGSVVGAVVYAFAQHKLRTDQELKNKLSDEVKELKNNQIKKLEDKLDTHLRQDNPEAQQLQLNLILGALNKTGDKVDRLAEGLADVRAEVRESKNFTQNLYNSMQKMREQKK